MRGFRQCVAEMRKELGEPNYVKILSEISEQGGNPFQSSGWEDWLHRWQTCHPDEKDRLLRRIFAIWKEDFSPEWWFIWLLMFKDELFGLFGYFRRRIPDRDERWSLVICSFLELLDLQRLEANNELSICHVRELLKPAINKYVHEEGRTRDFEVPLPDDNFLRVIDKIHIHDLQEEECFERSCRNMECFFNELSNTDKHIVEDICLLGHSGQICAARLGISRDQVNRRLVRIKCRAAEFLKLPILKRTNKPEKGFYGSCDQRKSDNPAW